MTDQTSKKHLSTRVIHGGQFPDPTTGAVMPPIYATSTFVQESPGVHKGLDYGRSHNPTRWALERCVADLESGSQAFAFASGLAAISTVLELADSGSHIIAGDDMYGGTYRLFERVRKRSAGHQFTYVDLTNADALLAALRPETRMVWLETPTNPMLKLADLAAIAAICRSRGIITVCDNTFASPIVQRPLEFGIDIVVHSTTKYMNGHSDIIGGIAVVGSEPHQAEWKEQLGFLQNSVGAIQGPFDSFLVLRGIKTLALRLERHCASALDLALWLEREPKVAKVYYPGLESHPQHALAMQQQTINGQGCGGAVLSFDVKSTRVENARANAFHVIDSTQVCSITANLGDTKTTITHPATTSHGRLSEDQRRAAGIGQGLIRVAAGLEYIDDLKADLARGLNSLNPL